MRNFSVFSHNKKWIQSFSRWEAYSICLDSLATITNLPLTLVMRRSLTSQLKCVRDWREWYRCIRFFPSLQLCLLYLLIHNEKQICIFLFYRRQASSFAYTRPSLVLLERVGACIAKNEAILLVGETGTGKTSTVQYLAELTGQRLKVINMNQQSDSTDLLGGWVLILECPQNILETPN